MAALLPGAPAQGSLRTRSARQPAAAPPLFAPAPRGLIGSPLEGGGASDGGLSCHRLMAALALVAGAGVRRRQPKVGQRVINELKGERKNQKYVRWLYNRERQTNDQPLFYKSGAMWDRRIDMGQIVPMGRHGENRERRQIMEYRRRRVGPKAQDKKPEGYIEEWDPNEVAPYAPGEGYGTNAVPFAGVAQKFDGPRGKMQALALLRRAKQIGDEIRDNRRTRDEGGGAIERVVPVPSGKLAELGNEWLQEVSDECGCSVDLYSSSQADGDDLAAYGQRWQGLRFTGDKRAVQAAQVRMMSALLPPAAGAA